MTNRYLYNHVIYGIYIKYIPYLFNNTLVIYWSMSLSIKHDQVSRFWFIKNNQTFRLCLNKLILNMNFLIFA